MNKINNDKISHVSNFFLNIQNDNNILKFINFFHKKFLYIFNNLELLKKSFTHSSVENDLEKNNTKLEILGDSLISFFIIDKLYSKFLNYMDSGNISKIKSFLVSKHVLSILSDKLNLMNFFQYTKNSDKEISIYIKCSLFESFIGCLFLDSERDNTVFSILEELFNENLDYI